MEASDADERAWIEAAQAGDTRAFERLYRMHAGGVYGLCLRLSADRVLAEGFTQDAFVRAWRKLDGYAARGPFGAWLRRLAINIVFEAQRRDRREGRWLAGNLEESEMSESALPSASETTPGLAMDLERAIATLPAGARQVFVLHDVDGWRQREIAELTGVNLGTVKAQLFRARRLLRGKLRGFDERDLA